MYKQQPPFPPYFIPPGYKNIKALVVISLFSSQLQLLNHVFMVPDKDIMLKGSVPFNCETSNNTNMTTVRT